jgi:molybdopterin biosynthesis enzyme MoaB
MTKSFRSLWLLLAPALLVFTLPGSPAAAQTAQTRPAP